MSHPGSVADPAAHGAHEAHHEELGFWRKYVFSTDHKVIGIQYGVTGLLFLLFGFTLMMLMRWQLAYPGAALPLDRQSLRRGAHAGRRHAPRVLQRARSHARHHHGLPRRGTARRRRIRQLRAPAPDWRAGHVVPEDEHGELLVPVPRWRHHAGQLFRARWSRAVGVDLLYAAVHPGRRRPDDVARRDDLPDHLVSAWRDQLHRHHHPAPREGPHLHAVPVLRVGPVRHGLPAAARVPAARGRGRHATDGSGGRHELLHAERPRRQRPGPRRTPAAATRCSGSTCSGSWRTRKSTS